MPREPKVMLTISETDARWLLSVMTVIDGIHAPRISRELEHALAECECARRVAAEETR